MKRRKFVQNAALAGALPAGVLSAQAGTVDQSPQKELIEVRTYEMRFRGNRPILMEYLTSVLKPAMEEKGATKFMMFNELGMEEPTKLWLVMPIPTLQAMCRHKVSFLIRDSWSKLPRTMHCRLTSPSTIDMGRGCCWLLMACPKWLIQ